MSRYTKKLIWFTAVAWICTVVCAGSVVAQEKSAKSKAKAVRTLKAINIEGEIAVPQVLFITSRDQRRYRDGLELKFRKSTVDVARSLDLPTRLRVVAHPKEEGR